MSGEKGLDRRTGMRGIKELQELFRSTHREAVYRVPDDVGVDMFGEVEADGDSSGTSVVRIVIGNRRKPRAIRESDRYRRRCLLDVRGARQ